MSGKSCEPVAAHERNCAITALLQSTDGEEELLALVCGDLLNSAPPTADETEMRKILELHEALSHFEQHAPGKAELVRLRYFVGLTGAEVARILDTSLSTVNHDWAHAKAWLYRELSRTDAEGIALDQSPKAQSYV
ncbi:MAG: hypothetical protein CMO80_06780 [Verrucomicrobiales bacterium]|nr:hypothetical protein [Verrucomicrobiales bacterium]|tara:strand:- start:1056 stop:1463 length:408 start_codon:yes stop_codon:yes gene_type:complete